MHRSEVRIAQLNEGHLEKIGALESQLDAVVVAYEPTFKPATLNEDQVAKLKALETELGLLLVAFSPK